MIAYPFDKPRRVALFIAAGGFEDRSLAFAKRVNARNFNAERSIIVRYANQIAANEPNYVMLLERTRRFCRHVETVSVDDDAPLQSCLGLKTAIQEITSIAEGRHAVIDVSAMRHMWAIQALHACVQSGLTVDIVYTEARTYYPSARDRNRVLSAHRGHESDGAVELLQSTSLKGVHILPDFIGNFRPGRRTCLVVFAGFEPQRIGRLIDVYAPGSVVVLYGRSPRADLEWRTEFSRTLHNDVFATWHTREEYVSTLDVNDIITVLDRIFSVVRVEYDVALAPHCSKMQGIASYLFWCFHPEIQLVFSSPVKFNVGHYSNGAGETYWYPVTPDAVQRAVAGNRT
jgi:hypothetical protein